MITSERGRERERERERENRERHREVYESETERWFGHVNIRGQEYVRRHTLEMVQPGRRRVIPTQISMGCVDRDMIVIGTTHDEVQDRTGCWGVHVSQQIMHVS